MHPAHAGRTMSLSTCPGQIGPGWPAEAGHPGAVVVAGAKFAARASQAAVETCGCYSCKCVTTRGGYTRPGKLDGAR